MHDHSSKFSVAHAYSSSSSLFFVILYTHVETSILPWNVRCCSPCYWHCLFSFCIAELRHYLLRILLATEIKATRKTSSPSLSLSFQTSLLFTHCTLALLREFVFLSFPIYQVYFFAIFSILSVQIPTLTFVYSVFFFSGLVIGIRHITTTIPTTQLPRH